MSFFLIKKIKPKINLKDKKLIFLLLTTIAPIFFILLTSMIMGAKIRTMWMTPFYLFLGVLLIYIFQKNILKKNLKKFFFVFSFFLFMFPIAYLGISLLNDSKRSEERRGGKECRSRWSPNH